MEPNPPAQVNPQALSLLDRLSSEIAKNQPGLHTTEFGIIATLLVIDILFGAFGKIPPSLSIIAGSFLSIGYQWLRNNRKDDREGSILNLVELIGQSAGSLAAQPSNTPNPQATVNAPMVPRADSAAPSSAIGGGAGGFALTEAAGVLAALAFLALAILTFTGCATNTGDPAKDQRGRVTNAILSIIGRDVTNEVVYSVANLGTQAAQGSKIDFAWAAQTALYQQGPTLFTSADVQNVIAAASAGQLPAVAQVAAQSFAAANPQTAADRTAVVNTIAKSIADGAQKATDVKDGKAIIPPQASRVHPEPYVWPQPIRFRSSPVVLRPESRTLYDEADRPIVPAIRADGALIVTRTND